jgi:hypothetical protein
MSTGAINASFFSGLGLSGENSSALTPQAIPSSKKNDKWIKATLDRLESIATRQLSKNIEFVDYYKMIRGELVYADYGLSDKTQEFVSLVNEVQVSSAAKHYDFLGMIVNQIRGEYGKFKSDSIIDTRDPFSQNEYNRDKTARVKEFTKQTFEIELQAKLALAGIQVHKQFENPEEQQQYLQMLEQKKAEIIPPEEIQKDMNKNWKTTAAIWGQNTLVQDRDRFEMDEADEEEITDYMLTGRFFRHYRVGYDFYRPERWNPCTTFFSEDVDAKYPQDGEYIGTIHYLSPSDIINKWGDKLTAEQQQKLSGYYDKTYNAGTQVSGGKNSFKHLLNTNFGQTHYIPFEGYYEYDTTLQLQDALDIPLGQSTYTDKEGNTTTRPTWFSPLNNGDSSNSSFYAKELRGDIDVRGDLLQVTESYWRSFQRIGLLTYINDSGKLDQEIVTDDVLSDFLIENEIKKLNKVTLQEAELNPQPNTIVFTYVPQIRWGVKVNAGNSFLGEDIYIGGNPTPYQIKGDSNIYDVKMPVAGIIGNSLAKKLRPFIVMHNICMNQIFNLLEKEIGTFLLFDVNYLPSEYKDNVDTKETLEMLREAAVEIGIIPIDTKKQNMQGAGQGMNTFMTQSITFTEQINNRITLAERYKMLALEQIGITPQRTGSASEYTTAEGIKQGLTASYAQTEPIFSAMSTANKKANHIHLTIAQYCQKNYLDTAYYYTKSDSEKVFIELSDPFFPLRNFGIVSQNSSADKKELENLKNIMFQTNTAGSDIMALAQIAMAKTTSQLVEVGKQSRIEAQQAEQAKQAHEKEIVDKQITAAKLEKDTDRAWIESQNDQDRETKLEVERISSLGKAADKQSNTEGYDRIDRAVQESIQNNQKDAEINLKANQMNLKEQDAEYKKQVDNRKLAQQDKALNIAQEKNQISREIAYVNKN